jgi:hypothetical protein
LSFDPPTSAANQGVAHCGHWCGGDGGYCVPPTAPAFEYSVIHDPDLGVYKLVVLRDAPDAPSELYTLSYRSSGSGATLHQALQLLDKASNKFFLEPMGVPVR